MSTVEAAIVIAAVAVTLAGIGYGAVVVYIFVQLWKDRGR